LSRGLFSYKQIKFVSPKTERYSYYNSSISNLGWFWGIFRVFWGDAINCAFIKLYEKAGCRTQSMKSEGAKYETTEGTEEERSGKTRTSMKKLFSIRFTVHSWLKGRKKNQESVKKRGHRGGRPKDAFTLSIQDVLYGLCG
jgi:hypothetical protein